MKSKMNKFQRRKTQLRDQYRNINTDLMSDELNDIIQNNLTRKAKTPIRDLRTPIQIIQKIN